MKILDVEIEWLGHDCFRLKKDKTIYFDPYQISTEENGDIIFITHEHYDHCSLDDIKKITSKNTVIVAAAECRSKLKEIEKSVSKIIFLSPGQKASIEKITVEAFPAYNTDKFRSPGQVFHPKEEGKIGYVVNVLGTKVYHAGDTDFIPEMGKLGHIDIALLPVSGTYVMTAEEAAEAAKTIKPLVAIPMHFGSIVGSKDDANKFKKLAEGVEVVIL